ncbi:uncharacterized protein LOC110449743 [Mizuhopecten yessoensis]|uniref:B box-type domain-containing protein n=1 Tax=Mizuhopecten yessoensis TaxID=6573 RepID=A0A210QQM6_MIZYE|nr:uncharacterized protein LOC110449743 [Mizuhopecten yessoensis]OWF51035.1 hypothetical protein KP79_PYT19583 [Mizuhopecten yessoensis]
MATITSNSLESDQTKLYVCKTCTELICDKCLTTSEHDDHSVIDLDDAGVEKMVEITDSGVLQELRATVKRQVTGNEALHSELADRIHSTGSLLKLEIDKQVKTLLVKCKQFKNLNRDRLAAFETNLISLNEKHQHLTEENSDVINSDDNENTYNRDTSMSVVDLPIRPPRLILVKYQEPSMIDHLVSKALGDLSFQDDIREECQSSNTHF